MMDGLGSVVESSTSLVTSIRPDASVDRLCDLLIECEMAQRRYQWASGFLLMTLMGKPDAPKKPSDFADWLAMKTGMVLTQKEIQRRVTVYRFYSRFADERIVALVECVGLRTAYHARRAIDHEQPEQARAVLQACIDDPNTIDLAPSGSGQRRSNGHAAEESLVGSRQSECDPTGLNEIHQRAVAAARNFEGQDWVPLALVIDLLAAAGHQRGR